MTNAQRAALLAGARTALMQVAMTCNTAALACACCQARRYEDFDDQQLFERLSGMVDKLDRDIERLRKKG